MLKVTFDGVEFTKASEVAKQFGYTSDYLGQLCRSKKVNARLVGRTWFVNVPSLEAHRENRYQSTKIQKNDEHSKSDPSKKVVVSNKQENVGISSKTYLKRVQSPKSRVRRIELVENSTTTQEAVALQYEPDDFSLIPKVDSKPKITMLKVDIAESESLKVKSSNRKESYLKPQPLPDVALSGKLVVEQIALDDEVGEDSDKRDKQENKAKIEVRTQDVSKQPDAKVKLPEKESKKAEQRASQKNAVKVRPVLRAESISTEIAVSEPKNATESVPGGVSFIFQVSTFSVAVASALLILTLEQVGYGSANSIEFSLGFSWENLASLGAFLYTGS